MDTFFSGRHLKEDFFENIFCLSIDKNVRMINYLVNNETFGNEWYNRENTVDDLKEILGKLQNASIFLDDDNLHP